jgi:hypothetical protein
MYSVAAWPAQRQLCYFGTFVVEHQSSQINMFTIFAIVCHTDKSQGRNFTNRVNMASGVALKAVFNLFLFDLPEVSSVTISGDPLLKQLEIIHFVSTILEDLLLSGKIVAELPERHSEILDYTTYPLLFFRVGKRHYSELLGGFGMRRYKFSLEIKIRVEYLYARRERIESQ